MHPMLMEPREARPKIGPAASLDRDAVRQFNKQTLGALVRSLGSIVDSIDDLEKLLSDAVASRNRLTHSFYLQHNFRRNSHDGRDVMLCDLEAIHEELLEAYKTVLLLSGVDLEKLVADPERRRR